ncbi:MAG: OsmC family protein [Thermodesulfobacteriota bacterium]|nr:MAG: OsmC family protein [Thermodesulfobacteriota bacterium]
MKINNVDVDRVAATAKAIQEDMTKAKKVNTIEGVWNTGEGSQFSATVNFEGGTMTLEADQPTGLGGGGTMPGPMIYCLYGSASCYAATFATVAASEGVTLRSLRIKAESFIDISKTFGLSENPIAEKVKFTIEVDSDAPAEKIREIEELAKQRCPAVYCLTNPVPLETELVV